VYRIIALYTDIGRGHPNYLDGLVQTLAARHHLQIPTFDVFQLSRRASRAAWDAVRLGYHTGSRGGLLTALYNRIRSRRSAGGFPVRLLARDLRLRRAGPDTMILVEHPLVARMLGELGRVYYVHGEIAAPAASIVPEAARVFVPLESTKNRFAELGQPTASLSVTGLMVEPGLVSGAAQALDRRLQRIKTGKHLTIGFFTSGAYPPAHTDVIVNAAASAARSGNRVVVFTGCSWSKSRMLARRLKALSLKVGSDRHRHLSPNWDSVTLVWRPDRPSDTARAVELMPELDLFVAAPHERTNWAVGLGLPMFALRPLVGPFARQNYDFALAHNVAQPLDRDAAANFGRTLERLRNDGTLLRMAENGFGKYPINGFDMAAQEVSEKEIKK